MSSQWKLLIWCMIKFFLSLQELNFGHKNATFGQQRKRSNPLLKRCSPVLFSVVDNLPEVITMLCSLYSKSWIFLLVAARMVNDCSRSNGVLI